MAERKTPPTITLELLGKQVRVEFAGEAVADTADALVLREGALPPVLYIPKGDIRWDLTQATDRSTHCPYKGDASYWSVTANGQTAENAIWGYPQAIDAVAPIRECVVLYWNKMGAWYLGGEKADAPAF